MQNKLSDMRKKFLRKRVEKLRKREKEFNEFINNLKKSLGEHISILLIGSRATGKAKPYSDYDIIIFHTTEDKNKLLEEIISQKPKGLPVDIVLMRECEIEDKIVRQMLKGSKILHDGIKIKERYT